MSETARTPEQELASQLQSLESTYQSLQSDIMLVSVKDSIEDMQTKAIHLSQSVKSIRDKGYVFENDLEKRCNSLRKQWISLKPSIQRELTQQVNTLAADVKRLDAQMLRTRSSSRNTQLGLKLVKETEAAVKGLEGKAEAASSSVRGMYDSLENQISKLESHLNQIDWGLNEAAESSFDWLALEGLVRAVKAEWVRGKKDKVEGVLYLTDQRLMYERKEEVATKKVLFIATEKELVQQAELEIAVKQVDKASAKKEGFMKHEDHLYLDLAAGAPTDAVHFHIDGQDCEEWAHLIRRASEGELDCQRITPISDEEVDRLRNAPTKCPSCGATITAPILRGQIEFSCDYCGAVSRF
ncbi:MAG: hypothetical protein JXA25_15255 [Anaerolineales bacterium]|nr:hypothetical protein [Anaerolineales bacterium]